MLFGYRLLCDHLQQVGYGLGAGHHFLLLQHSQFSTEFFFHVGLQNGMVRIGRRQGGWVKR